MFKTVFAFILGMLFALITTCLSLIGVSLALTSTPPKKRTPASRPHPII
jgi:hypothetical protein